MKCPYDGLKMEFLSGCGGDNGEPGYWCPGCEKSFAEDSPELPIETGEG